MLKDNMECRSCSLNRRERKGSTCQLELPPACIHRRPPCRRRLPAKTGAETSQGEREVKMETGRGRGQYGHFSCHVLSVRVPLPLTPNKSWMEGHTGHRKKIRGHTHATNFFKNTEVNTNFYKNIHVKYSERRERGRRSGEC